MSTPGPFCLWAVKLGAMGLQPFPVGATKAKPEGKIPLVSHWPKWKSPTTIAKWAAQPKFSNANIGVACGSSKITVIDVDHPDDIQPALKKFGATPLAWKTPKGGAHLVYKSLGELNGLLKPFGIRGDIRGIGGFVLIPPSIRLAGPFEGRRYEFFPGSSWADLESMPGVRPGIIPARAPVAEARRTTRALPNMAPQTGRNNTLFNAMLKRASTAETLEEVWSHGLAMNQAFTEPLDIGEVEKIEASVWGYQERGENWCGSGGRFVCANDDLDRFDGNGNAFLLFAYVNANHARRGEFAICAEAMASANIIAGWSKLEYRKQARWLCEHGFLELVHQGGERRGDVSRYRLNMGAENDPNIKYTPPSLPRAAVGDMRKSKSA
jgi:hypothetical protein